jgi:tRNA pseudouridine38-40 synthase
MTRTLKLVIAYDGTAYSGWQRQENGIGIQAVIEDHIAAIVGAQSPLIGAGRTDAGVHAAGQVASIRIDHAIGCDDLLRALNARLTADIRIRSIEDTFDGFDARHHAKVKSYRYAIWNGPAPSPFIRHVVWHVPQTLDIDRMAAAARLLIGEHDFSSFQASGGDVKTTKRRLLTSELRPVDINGDDRWPGTMIRYEVSGTGFLRHMVRNIIGSLVEIGRDQLPPGEMTAILEARNRARAGRTAPAQGLMLWKVDY